MTRQFTTLHQAVLALNELSDDAWRKLPVRVQDWSNAACRAVKINKPIPEPSAEVLAYLNISPDWSWENYLC